MATSSSPSRRELLVGLVMGALFLLPLLVWGPWDDEEVGLGIFSSQIYYRAIFDGRWPYWLNDLGFGTPMPIGQRLDFHPVFALASLVSLRVALSAVWLAHVAVMVVYFLRLTAASGIAPPMRVFLLACYVFSIPSVGHFYQTDWVSVQVAWTLLPVLVFYLREMVVESGPSSPWFATIRLALVFAFFVLNSHPGYIGPLTIVLGVYVLAAAPSARTAAFVSLALVMAAAVSMERVYATLSEMRGFPPTLPRDVQPGYGLAEFARSVVAPLAGVHPNLRLAFIGVVLGGCAVAAALGVRRSRDAHARACAVAFIAAAVLSVAPLSLTRQVQAVSAGWLFRDPMVFFGLLAGGFVLQRILESRTSRAVVYALLLVQMAQQAATIWPGAVYWRERRARLQFYRHQGHPEGLGRLLADRAAQFGRRLYVSEDVRTLMRGSLSHQGIHTMTDLVFLGVQPINGWFKGVSMDAFYPSRSQMHGQIGSQRDVVENTALLDVMGIALVLASERDAATSPGLVTTDHVHVANAGTLPPSDHDLVLLANRDAWPEAVLMTAGTQRVPLPVQPGCPHHGAMCRDFTALLERRLADPVALQASDGLYTARFAPADQERLLFVSAAYRPEWQARSLAGPMPIEPVAGAFLGVPVPPGVGEVELSFVPRVRMFLTWFSGGAMVALMTALATTWWRRPRLA